MKGLQHSMLLARKLAGSFLITAMLTGAALGADLPQRSEAAPSNSDKTKEAVKQAAQASRAWHSHESIRFQREWGVDIVGVRRMSSGEMLQFRYRVIDPAKAKLLNDKQFEAVLTDEKSGKKLTVPTMEKVGLLRTVTTPKADKVYWMIFANTENVVQVGNRVSVDIGKFHVGGLPVE